MEAHFEKELQVHGMGIKVLSLIFIDKVANYRVYNETGYEKGLYAQWFEEIYTELATQYVNLFNQEIIPAEKVHSLYWDLCQNIFQHSP